MSNLQRSVLLTWWLAHGETFTTREVASMFHVSDRQALRLLCALSSKVPIHHWRGRWRVCVGREEE